MLQQLPQQCRRVARRTAVRGIGPVTNDDVKGLTDINAREFLMLSLLAIAVLWMGLDPKPFTDVMNASVADLLHHVSISKLP